MKKQLFFFEVAPSWIIILMPILLISGPFLSDLGVSLIAILFLINSYKNNLKKYYNNYYFKIYFIFCLILILSSLLSDHTLISLKNSFFYFRFGIFSLCFWYLLEKNESFLLKYLFLSLLFCYSSLIVDGYFQYFYGKNLLGYGLYNEYRVSSFFGSELILGSYLARFFPIFFGLFILLDRSKRNKLMLFFVTVVFILSEGLIFISGERLALFFMNLSAVYIILMIKEYKIYRLWTYILSICIIVVMINTVPNSKERFIDQTINDFTRKYNKDITDDKLYIFSKPHTDMYITAYRIFLDNKFFGVGPRQFRNTCDQYLVSEYSCETHPHHTYIELLSESGIFAFLIIAMLFLIISYLSIKHFIFKFIHGKRNILNDFEVCLLSALIISLWPLSPSGSFFNNWMSIVYYFPIGLLLWQRSKYKN